MFKRKSVVLPQLKFAKVRQVKTPSVAYLTDNQNVTKFDYGVGSAGIDFYVPDVLPIVDIKGMNEKQLSKISFLPHKNTIIIEPLGRILIPSGIKTNIPDGYVLIGFNKSGFCYKNGLDLGACVIDENFQGEILINFINASDRPVEIGGGDKVVQFVLFELPKATIEIVEIDKLYEGKVSERGEGGFGSSNKL